MSSVHSPLIATCACRGNSFGHFVGTVQKASQETLPEGKNLHPPNGKSPVTLRSPPFETLFWTDYPQRALCTNLEEPAPFTPRAATPAPELIRAGIYRRDGVKERLDHAENRSRRLLLQRMRTVRRFLPSGHHRARPGRHHRQRMPSCSSSRREQMHWLCKLRHHVPRCSY